jgi:hypothetical protein
MVKIVRVVEGVPTMVGRKYVYGNPYRPDISRDESLSLRMKKEKFFVYILQSMKDFSFYIGQTNDLDSRMSKHFDG